MWPRSAATRLSLEIALCEPQQSTSSCPLFSAPRSLRFPLLLRAPLPGAPAADTVMAATAATADMVATVATVDMVAMAVAATAEAAGMLVVAVMVAELPVAGVKAAGLAR